MLFARLRSLALWLALTCAATSALGQPAPKPALPPDLSEEGQLARVVTLYDAGKYADCVSEFSRLIGNEPRKIEDPEILEKARVYYAACLIGNGQTSDAEEQFKAALRANRLMRAPDSLVFPGPVIDRFFRVKEAMTEELKKAAAEDLAKKRAEAAAAARRAEAERRRVERLEELASREVLIDRNSRWVAAVPFGVGQFQNRSAVLGYVFLGTEAALAATTLGAMVLELQLNSRADDDPPPDPKDLNSKLDTAHQVLVISSWSFLGVAALGVLEAQLSFVPEFRDTRKKALPADLRRPNDAPALSLTPLAFPTNRGMELGVFGRF